METEFQRDAAAPPDFAAQRRTLLLLALLPLAALTIFVVGLAFGVRGTKVVMLGLGAFTLAVGIVPLVLDQQRRPTERHLFLSFYALVFVAHYSLPVFVYYLPAVGTVDAPGMAHSNLFPRDVVTGQIVALLGYASLLAGYTFPVLSAFGRVPRARYEWPPGFTVLLGAGMIPVGLVITLAGQIGAIPEAAGTGVIGVFAMAYVYANCLLTVAIVRYKLLLPVFLLAVNIMISFLFGVLIGRKTQMLIAPAIVVLTLTIMQGRIRARWVVAGFVALLLVYPMSNFVKNELGDNRAELILNPGRTLGRVGSFISGAQGSEYLVGGLASAAGRMDGLGPTSVLVRDTPSRAPYLYGRTLGLFFVAFVPRGLWPDKPGISIGQFITDVYGSGPQIQSSTGPSPVGEYYINFGYLGVVVGMMFLGFVMRTIQETLLRHPATTPALLVGVVAFYSLALKFLGSVAATYSSTVFLLTPILLAHVGVRLFLGARPIDETRLDADPSSEATRP